MENKLSVNEKECMKIAFLVSSFPNLTETFILNQITGLLDRGHEVDIYAVKEGNCTKMHPEVKKYNLLEKVNYISDFKFPKSKLARITEAIGRIFRVPHDNPSTILKALNFFKYGKRAFSLELLYMTFVFRGKGSYDIIHCHFGHIGKLGMLLKNIGAIKGKILVSFYGFDVNRSVKKNQSFYKEIFDKGYLFIALSNYMRKKLIDSGCKEENIIKHPLGINPSEFIFRERTAVSQESVKILTVARLVKKKGLRYSIRAFSEILKSHNVEYIIVGNGVLRSEIKKLIKNLGIEDNVKIMGWCHKDELKKILNMADIFILTSVTTSNGYQEGTPTALLEAMSSGLPVISTYHAGIPEQVKDGKFGFLVPERDVDALTKKLEYLIEHPELWPKMGHAGRRYVEENYDIEKLNDRLVTIYEMLIKKDKT